ncbi:MAG: hypothetical protein IAF58_02340, partial [Leptolyngbya sp.]|nr:hypothetical protein [Candidatus Melainabacteria bacterium]
ARDAGRNYAQTKRAWSELLLGLRQNHPKAFDENPYSQKLFNKGNFAELDRLSDQLNKSRAADWDGVWKLDHLCGSIEGGSRSGSDWHEQRVYDLKKWLVKNPKSQLARTTLAQVLIYKAWDHKQSDSSEENKKFSPLMKSAVQVLNADPQLKTNYPRAINPYIREFYIETPDRVKEEVLKFSEEWSKRWPTYVCADTYSMKFLSTNWYGESDDVRKYIEKRSNTVGGANGDKLYAQLTWCRFDDAEDVSFEGSDAYSWKRVKAGFAHILKEFPNEMEARIAYLQMALSTDDEEAIKHVFDGMKK